MAGRHRDTNLGRLADWGLALLVVAIVGMIIVPLPTFLVDILISANFTLSVVLVLLVVTIGEPRRFAAFPTVLLLSTLYRLALNVSSTRLILLQADAGDVIRSFGQAVVRGNFVVGVIVFLVITVVQYVVIARGAERVAEVAARFALDALPGKQLAIDADLRAGVLRGDESSRRRGTLERESQLYGAMDGAMKLVKGDAIAAILITIVSVVGGLVIGAAQRGLSLGDAFRTYALLAIGDALVSQIPALLCATAAGLLVTRVAGDEGPRALGGDIVAQVLAEPRALWAAAGGIALLGLVPGLPAVPFLLLAGVTALVARAAPRAEAGGRDRLSRPPSAAAVEIGGATASEAAQLERTLSGRLYDELGVVADLAVVVAPDRSPGFWRVRLGDVPIAEGRHDGNLGAAVFPILCRHAAELLGLDETERLVRALEKEQPALVREVIPRVASLAVLGEILGNLVAEGISVRDLRTILGALARAPRDASVSAKVERTRAALRRQISHYLTGGSGGALVALRLDDDIEDAIRAAIRPDDRLALEPELRRDIVSAVGRAARPGVTVLVTPAAIRRHARQLLASDHPDLAVVAYDELLPDLSVETTTVSCGAPPTGI